MTDKELAKQAWLRAFKIARNSQDLHPVTERDAKVRFEQWWERTHSE